MKNKWVVAILIGFLLVIGMALPFFIYYLHFRSIGPDLSKESGNWGDFGDYIGGTMAVVQVLVTGYLAYLIERMNGQRKAEESAVKAEEKKALVREQERYVRNIIMRDAYVRFCDLTSEMLTHSAPDLHAKAEVFHTRLALFNLQFASVFSKAFDGEGMGRLLSLLAEMKAMRGDHPNCTQDHLFGKRNGLAEAAAQVIVEAQEEMEQQE